MLAWSTNQWAIVLLAMLAGMFIGMFFLAGGKWKRRYRDEVARREEIERERDNWAARANAASERITALERERPAGTAAPATAATASGAAAGGILGSRIGRRKHDDLSLIRGVGPDGAARLNELGIHRYKDIETLDDRQIAELEGGLGTPPGHVEREHWREQARLLREGKSDEHVRLYPQHAS